MWEFFYLSQRENIKHFELRIRYLVLINKFEHFSPWWLENTGLGVLI